MESQGPNNPNYGRAAFNGVLMHNDRVNRVQQLMTKYNNVNKHLNKINHNEQQLLKNLENPTKQEKDVKPAPKSEDKADAK